MHTKTFDPEKYGMILCPRCCGHGFIQYPESRNVCPRCGGFGFIRKEDPSGDKVEVNRKAY